MTSTVDVVARERAANELRTMARTFEGVHKDARASQRRSAARGDIRTADRTGSQADMIGVMIIMMNQRAAELTTET
jgi:hypothetical protein